MLPICQKNNCMHEKQYIIFKRYPQKSHINKSEGSELTTCVPFGIFVYLFVELCTFWYNCVVRIKMYLKFTPLTFDSKLFGYFKCTLFTFSLQFWAILVQQVEYQVHKRDMIFYSFVDSLDRWTEFATMQHRWLFAVRFWSFGLRGPI